MHQARGESRHQRARLSRQNCQIEFRVVSLDNRENFWHTISEQSSHLEVSMKLIVRLTILSLILTVPATRLANPRASRVPETSIVPEQSFNRFRTSLHRDLSPPPSCWCWDMWAERAFPLGRRRRRKRWQRWRKRRPGIPQQVSGTRDARTIKKTVLNGAQALLPTLFSCPGGARLARTNLDKLGQPALAKDWTRITRME